MDSGAHRLQIQNPIGKLCPNCFKTKSTFIVDPVQQNPLFAPAFACGFIEAIPDAASSLEDNQAIDEGDIETKDGDNLTMGLHVQQFT